MDEGKVVGTVELQAIECLVTQAKQAPQSSYDAQLKQQLLEEEMLMQKEKPASLGSRYSLFSKTLERMPEPSEQSSSLEC